jgi:uncharacterized protein (DUF302 family)
MKAPPTYTFGSVVDRPLPETQQLVADALRAEGFGVLTEIDVQATLRDKLGIERTPYLILGACNPELAHRALEADPSVGALLPCNVVLRPEGDGTRVEIMDPEAALGLVGPGPVASVAAEARERLLRVAHALEVGR